VILELFYKDYLEDKKESRRFVDILSGKADFKENIIYLRDQTINGRYWISLKNFVKIKREDNNSAFVRRRPN